MKNQKSFLSKGIGAMRSVSRFINPYPLRSDTDKLSCNPFFIVSSGRAGTTLLRAILSQSPDLCIPPESDYLWRVILAYQRKYNRLPWRDIVTIFTGELARGQEYCGWDMRIKDFYFKAKKLPQNQRSLAKLIDVYFQHYLQKHNPEAIRWGDKTPHYIMYLSQFDRVYPNAQYIHIYRDGRDVITSFLKLGWVPNVEKGCDMWLQRINAALAYKQRDNPQKFLEIRYEGLVHEPESITQKACGFLGITYQPEMLDFHKEPDKFRGDAIRPKLHPLLAQPITTQSIGKWRQALDAGQQAYIQERLGPTLTKLGYDLD